MEIIFYNNLIQLFKLLPSNIVMYHNNFNVLSTNNLCPTSISLKAKNWNPFGLQNNLLCSLYYCLASQQEYLK